jgi:hypothetical protein
MAGFTCLGKYSYGSNFIIHLIINWRWIVSVTIGKIRGNKTNESVDQENSFNSNKPAASFLRTKDVSGKVYF